jgi:hypothetical protein
MDENDFYFTKEQIDELATVLFKQFDKDKSESIDFSKFYDELKERPGLIESLWINLENWILPKLEKKKYNFKDLVPECMKWTHIRNNLVNVRFFLAFVIVNIALFLIRPIDFYDHIKSNQYYMIARTSGLIY